MSEKQNLSTQSPDFDIASLQKQAATWRDYITTRSQTRLRSGEIVRCGPSLDIEPTSLERFIDAFEILVRERK